MKVQDQTGNWLEITTAKRIVSLVPSQTELLFDLGLDSEVVGITKFCVHPPHWRREKTIVGGTKSLKIDIIHQLKPDLIIANKEENTKEDIEGLAKYYPVYVSDVIELKDAFSMIEQIGVITNTELKASQLIQEITSERNVYGASDQSKGDVAYLIWNNPIMVAADNTFINSMLKEGGWENAFENLKRYPVMEMSDLIAANPEFVFLSSEPFPFKPHHIQQMKEMLPNSKVILVDGEMFSWYGSRLKWTFKYLDSLIA